MNLYVIGPVTGIENENADAFYEAARSLRKVDFGAVIPHQVVKRTATWEEAMHASIEEMTRCDDGVFFYGGVAMIDGWEQSRGARIEHDLAMAIGIPCKPWRDWL